MGKRKRRMPSLLGVLETVLYVEAFERACPFYEQVLGLNSIYRDPRLCAYDVGHRGVLLLFLRGNSCIFLAAQFRRMTGKVRSTWLFPSPRRNGKLGKAASMRPVSPSKAAP